MKMKVTNWIRENKTMLVALAVGIFIGRKLFNPPVVNLFVKEVI